MNGEQIRYLSAMGIQPWQLKNKPIMAKLMIIGDVPGLGEDLFNAMLESINLDRSTVCITQTPHITKQMALINPTLLLAMGEVSAHFLLDTKTPLEQLRGKMHFYGKSNTPLIITYHPADLLRSPKDKAKAFKDLQQAQRLLIE